MLAAHHLVQAGVGGPHIPGLVTGKERTCASTNSTFKIVPFLASSWVKRFAPGARRERRLREIGILSLNNQRQHRTLHGGTALRTHSATPLEVRKTCIFNTRSVIKVPFSRRFVTSSQYTAGM